MKTLDDWERLCAQLNDCFGSDASLGHLQSLFSSRDPESFFDRLFRNVLEFPEPNAEDRKRIQSGN